MPETSAAVVRRELRDGDIDGIVDLHRRVYGREWGMNETFVDEVRLTIHDAVDRGWPAQGGVWLADLDGRVAGCAALTLDPDGTGVVHWVVTEPALRGHGLGKRMIGELVALARELGLPLVTLETFSELTTAAHIYRSHGFQFVSGYDKEGWRDDGSTVYYQRYELTL